MKKVFTLLLCLLYTFVTFGGSIFVHNCGANTLLSIYDKPSHQSCPLCLDTETNKGKSCEKGSCQDVEIKIDQLADDFFSSTKVDNFVILPAILPRLWMESYNYCEIVCTKITKQLSYFHSAGSAPPSYILNCNIRN